MEAGQIQRDYEEETGIQIVKTLESRDYETMPGVLVASHGPFSWGKTPEEAAQHSSMMEHVARMALLALVISPSLEPVGQCLLDKHFQRKHGEDAYYGQRDGDR
jgi:L-ribulose-5-phosphate 4-epimerase